MNGTLMTPPMSTLLHNLPDGGTRVEVRRGGWAGPSWAAEGRKYDQTLISEALPGRPLNVLIGGGRRRL